MPNLNMKSYDLTFYVAPEHIEAFERKLNDPTDESLLIALEHAAAINVGAAQVLHGGLTGDSLVGDYGADVIEVYHEVGKV